MTLKDVEKIELEAKYESLGRKCSELEEEIKKHGNKLGEMEKEKFGAVEKLEKYESSIRNLEEEIACLREEYKVVSSMEKRARERIARLLEIQKEEKEVKEKYIELMAGKRDLECTKKRAEDEIAVWKRKCEELEARVLQLEEENSSLRGKEDKHMRVEERNRDKQSCASSKNREGEDITAGIIEISDSEEDMDAAIGKTLDFKNEATTQKSLEKMSFEYDRKNKDAVEDDDSNCQRNFLLTSTPKRKCLSRVVTSDSEDDDNIPIGKLMIRRLGEEKEGNQESNGASVSCSSGCNDKKEASTPDSVRKNKNAVRNDDSSCEKNFISTSTPKRKCVLRVFVSDNEDDEEEDNIPIGKLKMRRIGDMEEGKKELNGSSFNCSSGCYDNQDDVTPSRRRLVPLRECSRTKAGERGTSLRDSVAQNLSPTETDSMNSRKGSTVRGKLGYFDTGDAKEAEVDSTKEVDDVGFESEGDSLGGFIISSSDSLESESCSNDASEELTGSNDTSEESGSDVDLDNVLARIRRKKDTKRWEYEADMLASFAKDPGLCMKAVCALYRQQTSQEQSIKETIDANNRGFNTIDAFKGSMIAEFLLDGDPHGPLKKSVQEFKKRYPEGLEYCRKLADRYSKQLFTIYQQREDPFFLPS